MPHGLSQCAPRHAQCRAGHRGAKNVQRLHRQPEAAVEQPELRAAFQPAIVELQRGQRVRRHHRNVLAGVQAGRGGVDDEGGDAARAGCRVGLGKGDIEIGDVAIADPGLAAVDGPAAFHLGRAGGHGAGVGAGIGFAQGKGGYFFAAGDLRQVSGLLRRRAGQRDGAAAQALHGKRKISQRRVKSQRFAQDDQRPRIERGQRAAQCAVSARRHAVAQPAGVAQPLHPFAAGAPVVVFIDLLAGNPVGQPRTEFAVNVVKERQRQVGGRGGHGQGLSAWGRGCVGVKVGFSRPETPVFVWRQRRRRRG